MPISPPLRRALVAMLGEAPLVYVDVGARRGRVPRWAGALKHTAYVGFEADPEECARLNAGARPHHRYVAAMLGRATEPAVFRMTANPACASLLQPNLELLARFADLAPQFAVVSEQPTQTISLDEYLAAHDVPAPDFLELDTQGSELDILRGGDATLRRSVLGVQVEVEFAPMYLDQPLFADVDAHLRSRDFELIDLSRYRGRRHGLAASIPTRGQLLWGHAIYLRRPDELAPDLALRLGAMAALLDLPDVAYDILGGVAAKGPKSLRDRAARVVSLLNEPNGGGMTLRAGAAITRLRTTLAGAVQPDEGTGTSLERSRGRATWRD